jgi:hypothetical protein
MMLDWIHSFAHAFNLHFTSYIDLLINELLICYDVQADRAKRQTAVLLVAKTCEGIAKLTIVVIGTTGLPVFEIASEGAPSLR